MSLMIRGAKVAVLTRVGGRIHPGMYRGDPGLFSWIGKAAKTLTGAVAGLGIPVVSGVAGTVNRVLGGSGGMVPMPISTAQALPGGVPSLPVLQAPRGVGISVGGPGGVQIGAFPQFAPEAPMQAVQTPQGMALVPCATKGTHLNRSAYVRTGPAHARNLQLIEKGTVCVKNRRMNPLNPNALSRSLRRIVSAKRATAWLQKVSLTGSAARRCGCGPKRRRKR